MFDTVVVGVGGADRALDALALAQTLVSTGGSLTLVHVEVDHDPAGDVPSPLLWLPDGRGAAGHPFVAVGAPSAGTGLHDYAARTDADLLVVGASRTDPLRRLAGGGDTSAVLADPPCAVAVATVGFAAGARAVRRVGVGYDGSIASEQAVEVARRLAVEHGAELSAFQAVTPKVLVPEPWDRRYDVRRRVDAALERIAALGVEAHAEYGAAEPGLRRYASGVDVLVLGAHDPGSSGPAPPSLAQRLADDPPCAVVALPMPRHPRAASEITRTA
jgi:nucleotide-binding universal stress UspA family protein